MEDLAVVCFEMVGHKSHGVLKKNTCIAAPTSWEFILFLCVSPKCFLLRSNNFRTILEVDASNYNKINDGAVDHPTYNFLW